MCVCVGRVWGMVFETGVWEGGIVLDRCVEMVLGRCVCVCVDLVGKLMIDRCEEQVLNTYRGESRCVRG